MGYLKDDILITHFPEVLEIKEQGHYEVEKVYPNDGKDLKWIVDIPGRKYQAAHDEKENIKVYIPYTQAEINKIALTEELESIKEWFDVYYAQHEQKYRRLMSLGKMCDDGTSPSFALNNLYIEAETKRARINQLESLIA